MKLKFSYDPACPHQSKAVAEFLLAFNAAKNECAAIAPAPAFRMIPRSEMVNEPTADGAIDFKKHLNKIDEMSSDAPVEETANEKKNRLRREAAAKKKAIEAEKLAVETAAQNARSLNEANEANARINAPSLDDTTEDDSVVDLKEVRAVLRVKAKDKQNMSKILIFLSVLKTKSLTTMDKADYPRFYEFLNDLK